MVLQNLVDVVEDIWSSGKYFLKKPLIYLTAFSVLATFNGCGKKDSKITGPEAGGNPTVVHGNGSHETYEGHTDSNGEVYIHSVLEDEDILIKVRSNSGLNLQNMEVNFYNTANSECMVTTIDDNLTYLPSFHHDPPSTISSSQGDWINIIMALYDSYQFGNYAVKFFNDLPNYDENHIINLPGINYQGTWTFNQIKNYSNLLNATTAILVYVSGGTGTPIAVVTNTFNSIVYGIDTLVDILNEEYGMNISKDYPYEFYNIPLLCLTFFLPAYQEDIYDIADYISVTQGNWWKYGVGGIELLTVEIDGFREISGINVPIAKQSDGVQVFQGFDGDDFKTFGYWDSWLVFYFPPILVGDDEITLGKTFQTETRQNDIGPIETHKYTYQDLQDVYVPAGSFDDCLHIKNTLTVYGTSVSQYTWIAEGVGQVKVQDPYGNIIELLEAYVDGHYYGGPTFCNSKQNLNCDVGAVSFFGSKNINYNVVKKDK